MLAACGLESLDDLYRHIPAQLRVQGELDLPEGLSEVALVSELRRLAGRNLDMNRLVCFAGGGAYDHYVPAAVWALAGRSELYTSYTPYQPELSQGVLQALFEYQSMICELTGLEISNASLYDGPTALVEAVHMAVGATRRRRVLVSGLGGPQVPADAPDLRRRWGLRPGGHCLPVPVRRQKSPWAKTSRRWSCSTRTSTASWSRFACCSTRLGRRGLGRSRSSIRMSLGVLAPPGELGVDVAVAEGQGLGNHLNYGGPYLGIIAARMQDVRQMPGRIVGETVDVDGRTGYVLTLQAREQHIRREKATSNICTNQTLMAVAATVYLAWLGPEGLRELGRQCMAKAHYAAERLADLSGASLPVPAARLLQGVRHPNRAATPAISRQVSSSAATWRGHWSRARLLVAVTEQRTREEIDGLVKAFEETLS